VLTRERRAEFHQAVIDHKLKADGPRSERPLRVLAVIAMLAGVAGSFVAYNASLAQDDLRDVASSQILAVAFLGVTVVGAGLFVASAVTRVLRLWLLRQLVDSQARADQLIAALGERE
jgi:uncharacterized membrane protein YcjF (UPF0283 family)